MCISPLILLIPICQYEGRQVTYPWPEQIFFLIRSGLHREFEKYGGKENIYD